MKNLLLENVEYKMQETPFGMWRLYMYPDGKIFKEFKSFDGVFGLPYVHYTHGINPETGKRVVARGVVAIGRLSCGILAIGHASMGLIAIGQLAIGLVFGLGQATTGIVAIGQLAMGLLFGFGQFATGFIAIGQLGFGKYVLAQMGFGEYVWSKKVADPEAIRFFKSLPIIKDLIQCP